VQSRRRAKKKERKYKKYCAITLKTVFFVLDASKTRKSEHLDGSVLSVRDRKAHRFDAVLRHHAENSIFVLDASKTRKSGKFSMGAYYPYVTEKIYPLTPYCAAYKTKK